MFRLLFGGLPYLSKRISVPSGDHFGSSALSAEGVSWRAFVPLAFITKIAPSVALAALLRRRSKTIFLPSGDQLGWWSSLEAGLFFCVNCVTPLPLAFIVK